jgi:hypothetical protein
VERSRHRKSTQPIAHDQEREKTQNHEKGQKEAAIISDHFGQREIKIILTFAFHSPTLLSAFGPDSMTLVSIPSGVAHSILPSLLPISRGNKSDESAYLQFADGELNYEKVESRSSSSRRLN